MSAHTDSYGSDDYNFKLSDNRAKSVREYIVSKGIAESRITSQGYGETKPVATNETDEGRQLNRRVEFKILKN
jgi:OmpA-OmpF porin, OOP family